jgi:prophage regulatory protein
MNQTNNDAAAEQPTLVFLSKAQVLKKIPVTAPTLWAWVRQGKFPRPRAIFNKTVWVAAEVDAWMQARPHREYKRITTGDNDGVSK